MRHIDLYRQRIPGSIWQMTNERTGGEWCIGYFLADTGHAWKKFYTITETSDYSSWGLTVDPVGYGIARYYAATCNSSSNGYVAGGYCGTSPNPLSKVVDNIRFSTDTIFSLGQVLNTVTAFGHGVNSKSNGYWGGASTTIGGSCVTIDKIKYDTNVTERLSNTLPTQSKFTCAHNSSFAGYYASYANTAAIYALIFVTESISTMTSTLTGRTNSAAFNSLFNGYWYGGVGMLSSSSYNFVDKYTYGVDAVTSTAVTSPGNAFWQNNWAVQTSNIAFINHYVSLGSPTGFAMNKYSFSTETTISSNATSDVSSSTTIESCQYGGIL